MWLDIGILNGSGTGVISADGKESIGTDVRGGGGGGRIAIYTDTDNLDIEAQIAAHKIHAYGGHSVYYSTVYTGGAGTIYVEKDGVHEQFVGDLYIDNNSVGSKYAALLEASYEFNNISVTRNGNLGVDGGGSVLTIASESGVEGDSTGYIITYGVLRLPDTFTVSGVNMKL